MKLGKDEEKLMNPLFPRLHINDADKGGPRAPPRNKMALCEPSSTSLSPQRFTSTSSPAPGSMSMPPLPHNITNSASSSHVACNKKSLLSLSHNSSESSPFVEILHPHSSGGMNFTMGRPDARPLKPLNSQVLSLKGNLPSTSKCNPFQPHSLSYSNTNPLTNKFGRENDIFGKPLNADKEKTVISLKTQGTHGKQVKETGNMQLKWRELIISKARDLAQLQKGEHFAELPAPRLSTKEKSAVHEVSTPVNSELNIKSVASGVPENRCGLVGDLNRSTDSNSESDEDSWILHKRKDTEDATTNGASCFFPPHRDNQRSPKRVKSSCDYPKGQTSEPPEAGGTDRSEGISEASSSNSRLVEKVSTDNVIGLIGQELFWKVRRTILHQQRIFAVQLFELHRLTKVQKLIAGSPDILFQGNFYLHQPSIKCLSLKKLPCDDVLKQKVPPKLNDFEHPAEKPYEKLLPLRKDDDKRHILNHLAQKPNVGTPTSISFVSDPKLAPQRFQPPPGYQWLVPIRSPSEGLIYKPYTGPCPPPAGFMAPVYGSSRPMPPSGDFPNVPYGVPTSHNHGAGIFHGPAILDQSCIQPYSLPVIKPYGSTSAFEQPNPLSKIRPSEGENSPSTHDVNLFSPKKPRNVSDQKSVVISTFQADRGSDVQGSTGSSPSERVQRDELSLFPVTPTAEVSDRPVQAKDREQRIQVIKVVPHNPKSASESAARIFRSIQEERKLNL